MYNRSKIVNIKDRKHIETKKVEKKCIKIIEKIDKIMASNGIKKGITKNTAIWKYKYKYKHKYKCKCKYKCK